MLSTVLNDDASTNVTPPLPLGALLLIKILLIILNEELDVPMTPPPPAALLLLNILLMILNVEQFVIMTPPN